MRLLVLACALAAGAAHAFSQNANVGNTAGLGSPPGHDHITAVAGEELFDNKDTNDATVARPSRARKLLSAKEREFLIEPLRAKKKRVSDRYFPTVKYDAVLSALYGQRWVDIAGTNIITNVGGKYATNSADKDDPRELDCFDGLAQDPDELQYDHFLRMRADEDEAGGKHAIEASIARLRKYFIAAATARPGRIKFVDGGLAGGVVTVKPRDADRNWFLFGRALHLLQDSFSAEHTVRSGDYTKLVGIKSYICTAGSEQHTPTKPLTVNYLRGQPDEDIIWKSITKTRALAGVQDASERNMKQSARAAIEASKDLMAAFARAMGRSNKEAAAGREIDGIIASWLGVDAAAMHERLALDKRDQKRHAYVRSAADGDSDLSDQKKCDDKPGKLERIRKMRRRCLYNIVQAKGSEVDQVMHVPYVFTFINPHREPPASWRYAGEK